MSSATALRTTQGDKLPLDSNRGLIAAMATVVASLLFIIAIVSLRPFSSAATGAEDVIASGGGDRLNQIGYSLVGCISLVAMACLADFRRILVLVGLPWIVLLAFVLVSTVNAVDPMASFRGFAFTMAAITTICAALVLPRDANSLATVITVAAIVILALNYAGVLFLPGLSIHSAAPPEPEHVGLWRGAFTHKNTAGPVMACLAYAGIYICRRGSFLLGLAIFAAATVFLIHTGSKTAMGLAALPIFAVLIPSIIGWRGGTVAIMLIGLTLLAIGTLGVVFIPPVRDLFQSYLPNMTYTGRTSVWAFGGEFLMKRPWTGYGLGGFWVTQIVANNMPPFDALWDVRGVGHGHNGYLDVAINLGLPALIPFSIVFIVAPARDYLLTPLRKENIYLADLFMMMLLFVLLNSFLETYFFLRADPVWLLTVFAVLGLRLVARVPYKTSWRKAANTR